MVKAKYRFGLSNHALFVSFPTRTVRLRIVQITDDLANLEQESLSDFSRAIAAEVPDSWPPEIPTPPNGRGNLQWSHYYLILSSDTDDCLVGSAGLVLWQQEEKSVEFGVAFVSEHRRKGLAQEFISAVVEWAQTKPEIDYVITEAQLGHEGAPMILEPIGFSKNGEGSIGFDRYTKFVGQ